MKYVKRETVNFDLEITFLNKRYCKKQVLIITNSMFLVLVLWGGLSGPTSLPKFHTY